MPSSWIEPIFPYSIIFNLATYFLLSTIFFILFYKKIINFNKLILCLFFLLSPFLFNGFLFEWSALPDQSKYLVNSLELRNNPQKILDGPAGYAGMKIYLPSILYAFSPIISLETYIGISLYNRALFLFTWIFFTKKKYLDDYNSIFFLLMPSLLLYTSVALRENLIIILMLWLVYFFYEKKFLYTLLVIFILALIKFQTLFIVAFFIIVSLVVKNNKINLINFLFVTLSLIVFFYSFSDFLIETINKYREGFFLEEYGSYQSISAKKNYNYFRLDFNYSSLLIIIFAFLDFITPPFLKGNTGILYFVQFIEAFTISVYLFLRIKFQKNFNKYIFFKWFCILLLSYLTYSIFIFNDGTILRYKVPIIFFTIFGYFANMKKELK